MPHPTPTAAPASPFDRLQAHWVYGGTLAALVLLALTPTLTQGWPLTDRLVWLTLPAYMLHQYEEHDADRFRLFVNDLMRGPALSLSDVFWINIVGVWAVLAAVIWTTRTLDPGWGVTAAWFLLVNGLGHLSQAAVLRRSNPGAWTAALLFVPLGAAILYTQTATDTQHALGLAFVLLLHAAIVLRTRMNIRRSAG